MQPVTKFPPSRHAVLTAGQVREFFERGWLVLPGAFRPREVERMRRAFDRLARRAATLPGNADDRGSRYILDHLGPDESVRIHRVIWCGASEPALEKFGADSRLLRPVAELLGSQTMNQLINQAHFKMPGDGVEFPWHQDSTHRRYGTPDWSDVNGRGSYVQTVIAVDEMTLENGPLKFLPGSAAEGHVDDVASRVREERTVAMTMEPGDVVMFGPYVFHASEPNRSTSPRRAFINGYACPGANRRVYPGHGAGRLLFTD